MYTTLTYLINTVFCVSEAGAMDSSPSTTTASLLRISRSGFLYRYYKTLPSTIARLAELTGGVACTRSDGLSEHVVASMVWKMIAAAVRIREFVSNRLTL